ncbi:MAG: 2-hydroxychromene-2-carboxylate isomerase [Burkholderiales bacterium]|nr:2-hydroxychromene-2-carboxylate isomerase [Burkholderiales bacterium]
MAAPIDFYFDFSSPYGYFASTRIDALGAKYGREVVWHPFLLGAAMKITGGVPLPNVPLKGDYAKRDFARSAKFYGVEYKLPSTFPISSQAPARAFYWLNQKDPKRAKALVTALYRAYFVDDINISNPEDTIAVCAKFGLAADEVRAAINDAAIKERVKSEVDQAIARGAFGSPYIVVEGEAFWGVDRLEQIEKWLASGGWKY